MIGNSPDWSSLKDERFPFLLSKAGILGYLKILLMFVTKGIFQGELIICQTVWREEMFYEKR
ncbi:MAG: hypothetical protein ABIJ37_00755 [Pseudomonadota bacterium]